MGQQRLRYGCLSVCFIIETEFEWGAVVSLLKKREKGNSEIKIKIDAE